MGLSGSKVKHNESLQEDNAHSTSTITPKPIRNLQDLDPRSPSLNIARTPLELLSTSHSEDSTQVTVTPLKAYKILDIDPRSPVIEFNRTPIVVNVNKPQPEKLKNKTLERVLSSASSSPRLVGSRLLTKSPEMVVHKRRSFAGLLETNLDFTETDLDAVAREKYKCAEAVDDLGGGVVEIKDAIKDEACNVSEPCASAVIEPISEECTSFEATDVSPDPVYNEDCISLSHGETDLASDPLSEDCIPVSEDTPLSHEAADIISAPIAVESLDSISDYIPNLTHPDAAESCSIPHSTSFNSSIPDVVPTFTDRPRPSSPAGTPPNDKFSEIDLSADIREFDRKLTNLIYEDRDLIVCPKVVELRDVVERSPLRSLNLSERKSAQKLRVSSKPRKCDYAVSKIPVFKDKRRSGVQCENTPPAAFLEKDGRAAGRRTRWDNTDATLYL